MKKEKTFRNGKIMKIIIIAVVILIPIIYSFFYLKSYWDPYGDLSEMNIAVVNLDKGSEGKNQGKEFVTSLKESGTFNICETSEDEANEGMQKGDYYATITIPSNFTECLNSASSREKQIATVTYSPNQATNYLATQIVNSAIKTIELNLEEKINKEITANLANKLKEVPENLEDISEGAGQILEGSQSLENGLSQLNEGTSTLNNSYTKFDNGIKTAYTGSKTLNNGVDQITAGATTLDSAISQINQGANELNNQGVAGIQALTTGASTLSNSINTYVDGADSLANNVNTYMSMANATNPQVLELLNKVAASSDATLAQEANAILNTGYIQTEIQMGTPIKTGAQSLSAKDANGISNGAKLKAGASTLAQSTSGLSKFIDGITTLQSALAQVQSGTQALNNGVSQLKTGSNTLTNGLSTLNNSSTTVRTAINTISEGTNSAYEGSVTLTDGVNTFKTTIDEGIDNTNEELKNLDGISDFAENPVNLETKAYGEVNSYGVAFTPLFLCIGLWVGSLMSYVVLYYDQRRRFGRLDHEEKNKFLQNMLYLGIGALQGIITAVLLKLGLGFEVENIVLYYSVSILLGVVFTSIIQFLIRNFGDVGKFVALIILVLQLAAAGGTFPIETIDKGFQVITPYLPMTYGIKLLREILVPTATNFKVKYIGILLAFTVIPIILTYVIDYVRKRQED